MPKGRQQPFSLLFHPNGKDEDDGPYRSRALPPTATPVDVENSTFSGRMLLVHDTGNEPEPLKLEPQFRKGVVLRIQGKFMKPTTVGELTSTGLWIGGELGDTLKLSWLMQNVVAACLKYAKKKCEGRLHCDMGGKDKNGNMVAPNLAFPLGQLFSISDTPPGEAVPPIDSPEWDNVKWHMCSPTINPEHTYTLTYKTPYMDLFTWELLKVPGVSPLPLESVLGDISSAKVFLYDLGHAGSHKDWKNGVLLEWHFARGEAPPEEPEEDPKTPLDCASEASDEEADALEEDEDDAGTVIEDDGAAPTDSSGESDGEESLDDENDDEISRADSEALLEIAAWRPRTFDDEEDVSSVQVQVPYYIDAIDRRRRRKMCVWYVFKMTSQDTDLASDDRLWWNAKAATELSQLCRPRRRLRVFRRGPGARRYACYAVKTLETFRQVVVKDLESDSLLKSRVLATTAISDQASQDGNLTGLESVPSGDALGRQVSNPKSDTNEPAQRLDDVQTAVSAGSVGASKVTLKLPSASERARTLASPARLARKVAQKRRRGRAALVPPRFFLDQGNPVCGVAFAHAKKGRKNMLKETLVGAVHFEGRLCEELLRVSSDGVVYCFTPYDCDVSRVNFQVIEVLCTEIVDELMLGRFYVWKVHTVLRVFEFCSPSEEHRQEWIACLETERKRFEATDGLAPRRPSSHGTAQELRSRINKSVNDAKGYVGKTGRAMARETSANTLSPPTPKTVSDSLLSSKESFPTDITTFLTDSTRARRWRPKRRLVLNDRIIISSSVLPPPPGIVEGMLESILSLPAKPSIDDLITFQDCASMLKAVDFAGWSQSEALAFWINAYHCLLLHGRAVLGTPKTKAEQSRFHARVSYMIGPYPLSLLEIERIMLRLPKPDPKVDMSRDKARQRARQMLGFCGMCNRGGRVSAPGTAGGRADNDDDDDDDIDPDDQGISPREVRGGGVLFNRACMPMPHVKLPKFPVRQETTACLFLGRIPERLEASKLELRVILCLNRGHMSCPKTIPVFHASRLERELDDVAQAFLAEYAKIEETADGLPFRMTLPQFIGGIKKEFQSESPDALLKFLWPLVPREGQGAPTPPSIPVKFVRRDVGPRPRIEFTKGTYKDPDLQVPLPLPPVDDGGGKDAREEPDPYGSAANSCSSAQTVREKGRLVQTIRL